MIGIVQVGGQAMADRYTYLPIVGLFVAAAWEGHRLLGARRGAVAAAAALAVLCALTWRQVHHWSDHEALFRHAVAVTGPNPRAHALLALGLIRSGKLAEAKAEALEALRLEPANARNLLTLGMANAELGQLGEAREALVAAVQLNSRLAPAWELLGRVEATAGNPAEARRIADRLERLDPPAAARLRRSVGLAP